MCVCVSNERSGRGSNSLWVCLLWSVGASDVCGVCVGVSYPGCCSPLSVFTGIGGGVCVCVSNERSGRGSSLWVCLLWLVGASDVVSG